MSSKKVKKVVYTGKGGKDVFSGDNEHVNKQGAAIIQSMNSITGPQASAEELEAKLGRFEFESVAENLGIDVNKARKELEQWLSEDYTELGKGRRFFRDTVLLKVFKYSGSFEYAEIIRSDMSRTGYRQEKKKSKGIFFPIARVLSVGIGATDYGLEVGDIVELNDSVMGIVPNPERDQWLINQLNAQESTVGTIGLGDAPPAFAKGDNELKDWQYSLDKFAEEEDPTIVLVPKVMIKCWANDVYLD